MEARDGRLRVPPGIMRVVSEHAVFVLTVAYFLIAWPFVPELGDWFNLRNMLMGVPPLLAVALGQTVVLIVGGIDLSVTSVIAMSSVAGAWVMSTSDGAMAGQTGAVPAAI